ncbi:ABC transporter permease [Actinomadura viridis]|uniref:ABC transporter permease n=1 Tax=Actinomadura viridis TaxID=58110 RepID=UPI0036744A92
MIWLAWRQFRVPAAMTFAALTVLAAVLAVTGPDLADEYASGAAACGTADDCSMFPVQFFAEHRTAYFALLAAILALPAIIGLFWGAPLVARELEAGTHRLAWGQSVTRARWLAVKLGLIGLVTVTVVGLGTLAVSWWSVPLDKTSGDDLSRMTPLVFDGRGIVPMAYAAFAFALGVTAGMLIRRTLPAMALTLAVFAAVQVAVPQLVRPHLLPPTRTTTTITSANLGSLMAEKLDSPIWVRVKVPDAGAWVLANETIDASGRTVDTLPFTLHSPPCGSSRKDGPARSLGPEKCIAEINRLGYKQRLVYQPAGRFWALQWAETGLYTVATLGLVGFCFWWIRRRLS